jgi:hypothetical protein
MTLVPHTSGDGLLLCLGLNPGLVINSSKEIPFPGLSCRLVIYSTPETLPRGYYAKRVNICLSRWRV